MDQGGRDGRAFWLGLVHIFMIDLVLSSDNAVIIGMACRGLPLPGAKPCCPVWNDRGCCPANRVDGRDDLDARYSACQGGRGGLLLWIAIKLMVSNQEETTEVAHNQTTGQAVRTIILADFVMSLDNVLAVGGAAHGDIWLVLLGLGMSIPLLMWGSTWVARLMNRFPGLVILGGGVLAFTAVDMCLEDPYVWKWINPLMLNHMWLPAIASAAIMLWGRMKRA